MKILMLTPYLPYPLLSGGQIRTYNLLKQLSRNHQITLFSLIKDQSEGQYVKELEKYCHKIKVFKRSAKPFTISNIFRTCFSPFPFLVIRNYVKKLSLAIQREIDCGAYDLIHAETFYMMPHIQDSKIPIILVEQTIEYLGYQSFIDKIKFSLLKKILQVDVNKIKKWENYYWQNCQKLIAMSLEDKLFLSHYVKDKSKIGVVENGVDIAWFDQKKPQLKKIPTILFVGTFKWLPNREAVDFLVEKVWPLIKEKISVVNLWIVGNQPTTKVLALPKKDCQIKVKGNIPDIRDAFLSSHVLLAPIFSGKGTRYKILEALASNLAVVATKTAVEGLNLINKKQVLIGQSATQLADLTVKILTDSAVRVNLAAEGKKFVSEHYDWHLIADKLNNIYLEIGKNDH